MLRLLAFAYIAALMIAAQPAAANDGSVHAIVNHNAGILLGGSRNGEWLPAAAVAPTLKNGERYRLYGLNGEVGGAEGGAPKNHGQPCPNTMFVDTKMSPLKKLNGREQELPIFMVAVTGDWNAVPRKPKRFFTGQPVYHEAAAIFLREHGIAEPDVALTQAIRVDLDGDGTDEVLVAGTRRKTYDPFYLSPSDYSFVYLLKLHAGRVETVPVAVDVHPDPTANSVAYRFDVMAVMDLNGDGVMEIVVQSEHYKGSTAAVFTVEGLTVTQVLIEGCGAWGRRRITSNDQSPFMAEAVEKVPGFRILETMIQKPGRC